MRACLITPGHLSTNPRLVKEAAALAAAGYEVTIVASRFVPWADAADRQFDQSAWKLVQIAYGPLASAPARCWQRLRVRACRALVEVCGPLPWLSERAFHPALPALARAARSVPADIYIAHNLAALPAACAAAQRNEAKAAFDAEDFHLGELDERPGNAVDRAIVAAIERRWLPRCAYVTAAAPGIARAYSRLYGVRLPRVVLNVFPLNEAVPAPSERGNAGADPSLYWFSQTIGPERGLENVVAAIGASRTRPRLCLRGQVSAEFRRALERLAHRYGVEQRLHFLPTAAPAEMVALAAQHDIGLATEINTNGNRDVCLNNKLFTYLLAGLPVLASATTGQSELARDLSGAVYVYPQNSPSALAELIDALLESPQRLATARRNAWQYGQRRFNWDVEREVFLAEVREVLGTRGGIALYSQPST